MVDYREPILKEMPLLQDVKTPVRSVWDYTDDCVRTKISVIHIYFRNIYPRSFVIRSI